MRYCSYYKKYFLFTIFSFFLWLTPAISLDLNLKFEGVYEHASQKIVVDGVSSSYGLGTVGIELNWDINQSLQLYGNYGLGYLPNYKLSAFGTNFSGPVNGERIIIGTSYKLFDSYKHQFSFGYDLSEKNVTGNDFSGIRNGLALTVESTAEFMISEFSLGYEYRATDALILGGKVGQENWNFTAMGLTLVNDITVSKAVNDTGHSPSYELYTRIGREKPIDISLVIRSYSMDNLVETYELKLAYPLYKS